LGSYLWKKNQGAEADNRRYVAWVWIK
jgi:hypothetical protein